MECDKRFENYITHLHKLADQQFPIELVGVFLRDFTFDTDCFAPYIFYSQQGYTRNLIYACPQFEVLLLCWNSAQESAIHGHEGEKCWMRVIKGELRFINYEASPGGADDVLESSAVDGSEGFVDGPAVIHKVENRSGAPALSLHLYARPFSQCDIYLPNEHKKIKIPITYDTVYGKVVEKK